VPIERLCYTLGVEDITVLSGEEVRQSSMYMVFLNGLILGVHRNPKRLVQLLRSMRRKGRLGTQFTCFTSRKGTSADAEGRTRRVRERAHE
jgi:DNA-directed RNA polymerase III subunit RPC2